jgi:hypothetical protein
MAADFQRLEAQFVCSEDGPGFTPILVNIVISPILRELLVWWTNPRLAENAVIWPFEPSTVKTKSKP